MRARYYRGEHEGKSWGGPWATATITVAGEPAETPTPEPAETPTPEPVEEEPVEEEPVEKEPVKKEPGQQPPRDDQTRDDPAPEDTTPPAGTIDTLAATDDDTGQLVLTWEAPAAPNATPTDYHINWAKSTEDYPADTAEAGNAHPDSTTHTLVGLEYDTDYNIRVRARYSDGDHAASPWNGPWTETTAQVKLPLPAAPFIGAIAVSPDREVLLTWFNSEEDDSITGYQILRGPDADSLVVIEEDTGSSSTSYTDETPPAGQTHTYGVKARNASGLSPLSDTVEATVPAAEEEEELITASQTAADNTLVSNLGSTQNQISFSAQLNTQRRRYAQTFGAANNADGTQAKFDFEGLTFGFSGSDTRNFAASHLVVTVNTDNSGEPGGVLYTLTSATTSLSLHIDDVREFTFNAPAGATLTSGVTYWLVFAAAPGSDYFDRDYINLALTQDDGEVQGTETVNHWSIGDTSLSDTGSATARTEQRVVMVAVLGLQLAAPLVSNLGQTSAAPIQTASDQSAAQAFVAAPGPVDFGYHFQGIRVSARGYDFFGELHIPQVRASLHGDSGGIPGARLHTLTMPLNFASTSASAEYTLLAPPGTVLRGGARYWVVFEVLINNLYLNLYLEATSSADEDPRLEAWSIDNDSYTKQASGWVIKPRVIKLAVLGSPQRVTDEPADADFPGAGHNAHQTIGVVTPGIVSTGHLTPGLDRNHGLYGDYWWLDTERGHSYRIEVEFGDSQNNDTGGSAWTYFIEGDRRGTCCESDHNRDDGYTFVHLKHAKDDRNRRYLINVAAFDKLNHNSRIYNGPYTITMADITGTEKVATNLYLGTRAPLSTVNEGNNEYAVSFTTGSHPGGYKLDRVRTHALNSTPLTRRALPEIKLRLNASGGTPGSALCNFLNPYEVQHHRPYAVKPLPVLFQGTHCDQVVLAAYTTYWLTLEGVGYQPTYTDSDDQQTSRSGWLIGNVAVNKTSGSWSNLSNGGTIPVEIWATTDLSRTRPDVPSVTVSFEQGTYTVAEGGTVEVTVTLDPDPERTVTVPLTVTDQDGASPGDYSGVPANVTFNNGDTSESFTFTATDDTVDDDGKSIQLGFGVLPTGVSTGGTATSTVSITDNDDPAVVVSFEQGTYTVEITVTLDVDPERTVTIPITKTNQGTASDADCSGVPANVVFGDVTLNNTSESFTFTATDDTVDDDGESVLLTFGAMPDGVSAGTPTETTVTITDNAAAGKVTLELTPATINESGTGNASTVTASIPSASSAATTVTVSVNPADTTTLTGNTILTILAGDTNSTGVVTITAVNDDAVTGNRTVAVSGTAVNSVGITDPDDVTLTITDDDTAAMGDPLVRGERKVGATLTGDTQGITDGDGLTNPGFNYQWQRMENGTPEDIPGAVSETYTLTDDDVGKRVQLQVRFNDDEGTAEMRTGPATSVVTKPPHLLVGNLTRNVVGAIGAAYTQSTGLVTGPHEFGYAIEDVTAHRGVTGPLSDGDAEIRVYDSTSNTSPVLRKPKSLIMTADDLTRVSGLILDYSARSRAKLDPDTTYHIALAALSVAPLSCKTAHQTGVDSDSLAGFSIIYRTYQLSDEGVTSGQLDRACALAIKGSELQSPNFVQEVEFTSTPAQPMIYATGETIEATVTLNQAVTFDGPPPVLLLQIGDNEREMTYMASASPGTSWVFRYTVIADDRDDDGMSFDRFALRGYADADLSNNRVINDGMHRVNAVSQIVSRRVSSSPSAPPWYAPGDRIEFTLEFSLPVTVVGDPQLEFSMTTPGPQNEFASYLSGSGTKELVFSYFVLPVDDDSDGIWWNANSIRLDSDDSITGNFNGLDADLDHTERGKLEDHRIDPRPRAISQEVTSDPVGGTDSDTYGVGDMITFEVVFNQQVTVSGTPRLRFSITGPGDEYATYVSGSESWTLVFSYTVLAADMDADGIYLYDDPLNYPDAAADSIVGPVEHGTLPAANAGIGKERVLSGHKVDGSITN